jgi:hypothetical protein
MKLIHTRTNQLKYILIDNFQDRVYEFGVFYNTYKLEDKLQYNYQFKDSFSFHLMSLIIDNFLKNVNSIIALLSYHNCLYYNHTEFGLNRFASHKTWYHEKQNKPILNRICHILIWDYKFNRNIEFTFIRLDRVWIEVYDPFNIIDFVNQDLINMIYEIAQQNKKIEKELTFTVIYNLLLR